MRGRPPESAAGGDRVLLGDAPRWHDTAELWVGSAAGKAGSSGQRSGAWRTRGSGAGCHGRPNCQRAHAAGSPHPGRSPHPHPAARAPPGSRARELHRGLRRRSRATAPMDRHVVPTLLHARR